MNNLYTHFFLLLFLVPAYSLVAQDSIPENKIEKISLKINLEPNTSYRFINNNTQKTVHKLMEMEIESNLNSTVHYLFEVESTNEKETRIKASYERFALDIQVPQSTIKIDTDQPEEQQTSQFLSWFSSLINKPFYIILSNQGKVLKLEGLSDVLKVPEIEDSMLLEKAFSSQNLLFDIESNFYIFPQDSTALGQSWQRDGDLRLSSSLDLNLKKSFTLESLSEDMAWVNVDYQIKNDHLKASPESKINLSGTGQGLIELDRVSGLILFSETQQEIEANIQDNGIAFPLKITSTSTLNGEKL